MKAGTVHIDPLKLRMLTPPAAAAGLRKARNASAWSRLLRNIDIDIDIDRRDRNVEEEGAAHAF